MQTALPLTVYGNTAAGGSDPESDADLLARVEKAEFPLCFLQLERTPQEAFESGADVLFKRVVEREGIDQMTEWNAPHARDYLAKYEQLKQQP